MYDHIKYWYNDGEGIYWSWVEPNISHVVQKYHSIGIPNANAVQYNYKNKCYNYVLKIKDMNNKSIIENIMKGDV
jgi:hypothetical protein